MSALMHQATLAGWLRRPSSDQAQAPLPVAGVDASRLAIHRNTYLVSLMDALAEAFPVTRAITGDAFFRAMARQRVLADPPHSPRVVDYADGFPRYIAEYPPAGALPFLASVARLEVLRLQAYHAADAQPLALACFQELCEDPDRLRVTGVRLHPSAHWLRSRYAIHQLWSAHQAVADLSTVDLGGIDLRLSEDVLVTRPDLDVEVVSLPHGACDFLDALAMGASLQAAVEESRERAPATDATTLFSLLLRHGLAIALVDTRKENP